MPFESCSWPGPWGMVLFEFVVAFTERELPLHGVVAPLALLFVRRLLATARTQLTPSHLSNAIP